MIDVRSAASSLVAGAAVFGSIELATVSDWVAKPAVGGVVAMVVWWLQSRIRKQEEAEKAQEALAKTERDALHATLRGLRADVDAMRAELRVEAERHTGHIKVTDAQLSAIHKEHDDAHARWRREHEALMRDCDGSATDAKTALDAVAHRLQQVSERLTALESAHEATHHAVVRP